MDLFKDDLVLVKKEENVSEFVIEVNEHKVNVIIVVEKRRGSRVSFTKRGVMIRLQHQLTQIQRQEQIKVFLKWAKDKITKHPGLLNRNTITKKYNDGDQLEVYDEKFKVQILTDSSKYATVKVRSGELILIFPENSKPERRQKMASKLVAKIMANYFQPKVEERIHEINAKYFQKKVSKVTLKNNSSNWGSCSIRNNINISTRLLLTPQFVIDYVLIHELTHLVHMDHSDRFWNHVESIMPDYNKAEQWLKVNGDTCFF